MVAYCCAYNCKERGTKGSAYSFHSFPKDPARRRMWEMALLRDNFKSTVSTKICSKHFEDGCFDTSKLGGTWLKSSACPTKFDFPAHIKPLQIPPYLTEQREIERLETERLENEGPTSTSRPLGLPRKFFLGDFNESDMDCPDNARHVLRLVKDVLRKKRSTVRNLKQKNLRYEKNISKLKEKLFRTERKLYFSLSGNKNDSTSVDHDVSANLEMELTTGEPESDHEMAPVPAITMKEEPMSDPEDDAPCPGASTTTTPSVTSVTSLAKFSAVASSSGEILGVPFGDLPTRPGSTPSVSPSVGTEASNSATNGGLEKNRFLPSTSPTNDSGEEAKFVPDYRTRDQFDVYGEYIASKLRRLDWRTCAHVQKAFSDIIFDAEMGKYS